MIEKKLKKAADNIKMSDELKNRIAGQCRNIDAERSENEHVFTVETYKPRRISRFVSGLAACTVLVGSVGTAGWLISRNSPMQSDELDADITSVSDQQNVGAPFGDLTERQFYLSYQSDEIQKPSDEMKIKLASYFNEMSWETTETYIKNIYSDSLPSEETPIDFDRDTSIGYIQFIDLSSGLESLYIYPENYVVYSLPDDVQTAYKIDFNDLNLFLTEVINEEKSRIEGENYENISEKLADVELQELINECPFGDLTEYSIFKDLPLEKQKELLYLFSTQKFEEIESTFSLVQGSGILEGAYLDKEQEYWGLTIFRSGYMVYTVSYESDSTYIPKFYRIPDYDEFKQKLGNILYGDCLTGMDAPFVNEDEFDWTCTKFDDYRGGTLPQSVAKELKYVFMDEYWIRTDKDSIAPATDRFIEITHDGKKLLIDYGYNCIYATYNDGNSEQYFTIHGGSIETFLRDCIIFENQSYPPIGNIYKMTQELYCESEAFTGDLTEEQIRNVSMAFYNKRWNEEQVASFLYETHPHVKLMYKFTSPPDSKGHSEIWCVYEDSTIEFKSYTSNPYYDDSDDVYISRFRNTDVNSCLLNGIEWSVTH